MKLMCLKDPIILWNHFRYLILDFVGVVPLPTYSDVGTSFAGATGRISGWGLDSDTSTAISQVLREVFVSVITNFLCNISFLGAIQSTHICTSGADGRGACSGDSGGPLVVDGKVVRKRPFSFSLVSAKLEDT